MDDLISRQAAITLPVIPKEYREYQTSNLDDAYEQGWNDLQKCIESLPSAQQWIPVSERLPEEKTNVLILADTIAGKMAKVSFLYKDDEGRVCWTGLDVYGLNPCDWQPTHWMPLPSPYKENNHDR